MRGEYSVPWEIIITVTSLYLEASPDREGRRSRPSLFILPKAKLPLPCSFSFLRSLFSYRHGTLSSPRWVSDPSFSSQPSSPLRLGAAMAFGLFSPTTTAGPN